MKKVSEIFTGAAREWTAVLLAVVLGTTLAAMGAQAATTISTNIDTGGTLNVDGAVTLNAGITLGNAVGDAITATGYFTQVRIGTGSTFGHISDVGADELGVEGDMEVDGTAYFDGTVQFAGLASTSALKVGDEPAAPTINGLVFGYCSFADVTSFTASTTKYVDCTSSVTGALTTNDRVFVMATSSFDNGFIIQAASTTGVSTINLKVLNTGIVEADATLGGTSVNFWAVRP